MVPIAATPANRKQLHRHAREALAPYSRVMTWLVVDGTGELCTIVEPEGQSVYVGADSAVAVTGGFHKAHGAGASIDPTTGRAYRTHRAYLTDLLGPTEYRRLFGK